MSKCIEKLPHSCGTSDALQVFMNEKGEYNGFCFACSTYIDNPYPDGTVLNRSVSRKESSANAREVLEQISNYPILPIKHRHLEQESIEYFGVKTAVSEEDGTTPTAYFFPFLNEKEELIACKVKTPDKSVFWIGEAKKALPFGWHQALISNARNLFVTEGEEDAIALWQALKHKQKGTQWEHLTPAVISVKNGSAGAAKEISALLSSIRHNFRELVICFDMDDPGKEAAQKVLQIIPTARVVSMPEKDANECVIKGRTLALANAALFKATTPKNTRIIWASDLYDAARQPAEYGLSWPWEGMSELTRGIRPGETTYIGAGVKMGKGEVRNTLIAHLIVNHDLKVFVASPEEVNKKTIKLVLGKVAGRHFHDPNKEFDFEAYDKAAKLIGNNLGLLDVYQHLGWDTLKLDIQQAATEGVKAFFIDPITNLTNHASPGEANTLLQGFAQDLAAMSKDLDLITFLFCHLKAPDSGQSHERGGEVLSHQFAGSRAMMRSCNYMMGIEGNKNPELPIEERNVRKLVILEDREFGSSGYIRLYWDHNTGLFTEID